LPEQNEYQKEWDGENETSELKNASGIARVQAKSSLNSILKDAKKRSLQICYCAPNPEIVEPFGFYSNPGRRLVENEIKKLISEPKDIRIEIARLRQIKQPIEIEALQKAIDITADTLADVKQNLQRYNTEKELERAISSGFFARGGDGHGYEPIIASGKNACVLHYNKNTDVIYDNALTLLDVGALSDGYSADISRVWALGTPTDMQKTVFEAVCALQDKAFSVLGPGVKIRDYQKEMEGYAFRAMKKLGLEINVYPHGFSHFLGLDVHDAGDYDDPLAPGSVITVEPGIYLSSEGVGVRIEDNILITENGIKNLSIKIPRSL
jgi:Xaa-Pro aminopeptidase